MSAARSRRCKAALLSLLLLLALLLRVWHLATLQPAAAPAARCGRPDAPSRSSTPS